VRETRPSFTAANGEHEATSSVGLGPTRSAIPSDEAEIRVERLYGDYAGRVYRYCLSRLDSPEEAEDALQTTYLNAWRSLSQGAAPVSARPWLFQIAANVCSGMLRTRLAGAKVELRSPAALDRISTNAEPNDDLLGLPAALERLPVRQRHALLLRDWRGLSYDEIATELNSSYQAVETLLFRARKSVAAGLRKPETAKVPARARAFAPLPFLIPVREGFSAVKSALSASVAPIKVSLGIALGATAPLVAYGVLERGVDNPARAQTAAAPTVQLETPLTYTVPTPAGDATNGTERPAFSAKPSSSTPSGPHPDTHGGGAAGGSAAGNPHGSAPGLDPAPPPETTTDPPPVEEEPSASNVTICHHTDSLKNPIVTITVDAAAVDAHLEHGDNLGACAE